LLPVSTVLNSARIGHPDHQGLLGALKKRGEGGKTRIGTDVRDDRGRGLHGIERCTGRRNIGDLRLGGVRGECRRDHRLSRGEAGQGPLVFAPLALKQLTARHLALQRPGRLLVLRPAEHLGQRRRGGIDCTQPLMRRGLPNVNRNPIDGARQ